jgi:hypothetical protein
MGGVIDMRETSSDHEDDFSVGGGRITAKIMVVQIWDVGWGLKHWRSGKRSTSLILLLLLVRVKIASF